MQLNGAEIVIECLKEQGVDTVFGYPGGAILNVYDELYKHRSEIRHILTSHEQGASHAADGYARATGKVGVCLATSGPGATNLVTGIATAYMDSIPIVAITCNVGVPLLGKDSFQEIDITGITMPITKYSFIVKDVKKLADTIRKAFRIAKSGRPGPVLIDIPKDVTSNVTEYIPEEPGKQAYSLTPEVYGQFLMDLFDRWYEDVRTGDQPYIRQFENVVGMLAGREPESCEQRGICSVQNVIEADGSVYPCDFYALDEYCLGNVSTGTFEEFRTSPAAERFVRDSAESLEDCRSCPYFAICRGGCRRNRITLADEKRANYFCRAYRRFYDYTIERFLRLAGR